MLRVSSLEKTFNKGKKNAVTVLSDISFTLEDGEKLAVAGVSGVGKSTLARILTGLERPDRGSVELNGVSLWSGGKRPRYDRVHGRKIQMVFQSPYDSLDPMQKAGRAVEEALLFSGGAEDRKQAVKKRDELFELVRLPLSLAERRPSALSGGQAQRVAIARALALSPEVLIADEATAMLDVTSQAQIVRLLTELNRDRGLSLVFISHDADLLDIAADRILTLKDGALLPSDPED